MRVAKQMNTRCSLCALAQSWARPLAAGQPWTMSQAHLINNFAPFLRQAATANVAAAAVAVAAAAAAVVNCHR